MPETEQATAGVPLYSSQGVYLNLSNLISWAVGEDAHPRHLSKPQDLNKAGDSFVVGEVPIAYKESEKLIKWAKYVIIDAVKND